MRTRQAGRAGGAEGILAVLKAARDVPAGRRYDLELTLGDERVPAIFSLPRAGAPVPAALLLHGFGSRKERMADTVGDALMRHGIAALAVDLPMHGARAGSTDDLAGAHPMRLIAAWRSAVQEARLGLEYVESHTDIDAMRLAVVGYSLGSFMANIVAAEDEKIRAVVLAASGDLPDGLPFEPLVRAVVDPLRAVRRLGGRPLLMINGRFDRTVKPAQAERLFAAAGEPKTLRWYQGGHWPPASEVDFAAEWLAAQLDVRRSASRRPRTRASTRA